MSDTGIESENKASLDACKLLSFPLTDADVCPRCYGLEWTRNAWKCTEILHVIARNQANTEGALEWQVEKGVRVSVQFANCPREEFKLPTLDLTLSDTMHLALSALSLMLELGLQRSK